MLKNRGLVFTILLLTIASFTTSASAVELPFYFPDGVKTNTDLVGQWQEHHRYLNATEQENQSGSATFILGSDSIEKPTDILSTSTVDKNARMKIILDQFVRVDGKIRVTTLNGQRFITEDELKVVIDDLVAMANQAADEKYAFYKDFVDRAIKARALKLGIAEKDFRDMLDKKLTGQNVTYREYNLIPPVFKRSDFVPRELHLGYTPQAKGILGSTWLNSGIIYYNPQARILDYLTGRPLILGHEMVHGNSNLQSMPIAFAFDVETMASVPQILYPEEKTGLIYHGYANDLRELIWVYFGFDFEKAQEESLLVNFSGNQVVDEKKYRANYSKLDSVKAELLNRFRDDVIPEFYSDVVFWTTMNTKMGDKNFVFQVMMAKLYKPSILGSDTAKWLDNHSFEIKQIALDVYNRSGPFPVGVNYREEFLKKVGALNYSEKEKLAALHYSYKYLFVREDSGGSKVAYSMLLADSAISQTEFYLSNLNFLLDTSSVGNAKYVDYIPGLRVGFTHDLEVMKAINASLKAYVLKNEFDELLGNRFSSFYNPKIFLVDDLVSAFPFTTTAIEEARTKNQFQIVDEGTLALKRKFDHKEGDPSVWVASSGEMLYFAGMKITADNNPDDNQVDLIEVYRYKDGKRESKPAVRIFVVNGGQYEILVLDVDKEGEYGFGLPDYVEAVGGMGTVEEVMKSPMLLDASLSEYFGTEPTLPSEGLAE